MKTTWNPPDIYKRIHNKFDHFYWMSSVMKGWFRASLVVILALGSIFRHLLRKSMKFLLSDWILLWRLVNFGRYILEWPVFRFFLLPSSPVSSTISSNRISSLVKYFWTSVPVCSIQDGQGPLKPWIFERMPTTLSLSKSTWWEKSSAMMQPRLQISIF